jgi:hypothetical protein
MFAGRNLITIRRICETITMCTRKKFQNEMSVGFDMKMKEYQLGDMMTRGGC